MRFALIAITLFGLAATGCSQSEPTPTPPPAPAKAAPPDYTVVAKNLYRAGEGAGKSGYYVTIMLFGSERETQVSSACYSSAQVGTVLAANCR